MKYIRLTTRNYSIVVLLLVMQLTVACGPSLRSSLGVPAITIPLQEDGLRAEGSMVYVEDFLDTRPSRAIARVEDREVAPADDVSAAVMEGFIKALERKGFRMADTAPVVLSGEIREWVADVESGFNSRASASASLYVEVLDPANRRVYSGVYQGFATKEAPGLKEEDVQAALKNAMTEAILQVTGDAQLVKLLASY